MSVTFTTPPPRTGANGHEAQAAPTPADPTSVAAGKARWPLWGAAGGVIGLVANFLSYPALSDEDYTKGVEVVDKLEAGQYRISFVLGLIAIGCIMVAAAGWTRWAEARAPRDLAARLVGRGLAATATIMVIFFGIVGSMGLYLPGGVEETTGLHDSGLYVNHVLLDFGTLLGWWGAAVAAIAVAVLAFKRTGPLPRWMGVVSVVFLLPPVGMALATSLPGLVGFFLPLWLAVISIGMAVSKKAGAAA
jgi:hypothetical protein